MFEVIHTGDGIDGAVGKKKLAEIRLKRSALTISANAASTWRGVAFKTVVGNHQGLNPAVGGIVGGMGGHHQRRFVPGGIVSSGGGRQVSGAEGQRSARDVVTPGAGRKIWSGLSAGMRRSCRARAGRDIKGL